MFYYALMDIFRILYQVYVNNSVLKVIFLNKLIIHVQKVALMTNIWTQSINNVSLNVHKMIIFLLIFLIAHALLHVNQQHLLFRMIFQENVKLSVLGINMLILTIIHALMLLLVH